MRESSAAETAQADPQQKLSLVQRLMNDSRSARLLDRSPFSDNMYAILRRAPVIAPFVPTPAPRA
jgi:hypothetical protein